MQASTVPPRRMVVGVSGASGVVYGVRLLQARDVTSVEAVTHTLEQAWREGLVDLTLLQGRTPLAVAA